MTSHWLLKGEPAPHIINGVDVGSYPFERFKTELDHVGEYSGVRNFQARNNIRDNIEVGQQCFYYHSSVPEPGIAGIVEVVGKGPDRHAADPGSVWFDPKHTASEPRWYNLQLKYVRPMRRFVSLAELRAVAAASESGGGSSSSSSSASKLSGMVLLRVPRLSVQPVSQAEWAQILALEATEPNALSSSSGKRSKAATKGGEGAKKRPRARDAAPGAQAAAARSSNSGGRSSSRASPSKRKK